MKRLTMILLALLLALTLAACGSGEKTAPAGAGYSDETTQNAEQNNPETDAPTAAPTETPAEEPTEAMTESPAVTWAEEAGVTFETIDERDEMMDNRYRTVVRTCTPVREFDMEWYLGADDWTTAVPVLDFVNLEEYGDHKYYEIKMSGVPGVAVDDGEFSLTYELFDLYTGKVLATSTNAEVVEGDSLTDTYAYKIEFDGKKYPIVFQQDLSLTASWFMINYRVVMPADYDGLGIVLAYSSRELETTYEPLMETVAGIDDYEILNRPDYKLVRVEDLVIKR